MQDFFKAIDIFGKNVPSLHIRGDPVIKTFAGATMSTIVIGLAMMFALLKLQFMLMRTRPDVM